MNRAAIAVLIIVGLVAGIAAGFHFMPARDQPPVLERATFFGTARPLPEFGLVDQTGRAFDRDRLRDRWTFLFFGFVNCPDVCPTTLATLAEARRMLAGLPADEQPQIAFVSVDPARDTPEVLARYVAHFDPAFAGVTGSADAIEALTRQIGVAVAIGTPAADGSYAVDHTAAIFLIDPTASQAALFSPPHEAAAIANDYRRIVAARRR